MRTNAVEKPVYRPELRDEPAVTLQPLMTPARRMALEALEREFQDLLNSKAS
jgi:hypothetical protein